VGLCGEYAKPRMGLIGMNFVDGLEQQIAGYMTTRFDALKRYGFIWGLGVGPNAPAPSGYASSGDWFAAFRAAQAEAAAVPAAQAPILSLYCIWMERDGQRTQWLDIYRKINDYETPSDTLDLAHTWMLTAADGSPVVTYGTGSYGINLTSAPGRDPAGLSFAEWVAQWYKDNAFGHLDSDGTGHGNWTGVDMAPDNMFGMPAIKGNTAAQANWLLNYNGQGTSVACNSTQAFDWPDGHHETLRQQWRRNWARVVEHTRELYDAGQAPGIWPNIEISTTDLSDPEYVDLVDGGMIETPDRKSTRLNSSHRLTSRMPSSA
jgi:hypothetical protein